MITKFLRTKTVALLAVLSLSGFAWLVSSSFSSKEGIADERKTQVLAQLFNLPMYFESNQGQMDANIQYVTRGCKHAFYFTPQEIVMVLKNEEKKEPSVLKMQFIGANSNPLVKGMDKQKCKSNYLIGNDPQKWHTDVPNYAKVNYEEIYPGIDAVFYGNLKQLEYDLCVAPGVNPQKIRLHIEGAKDLVVDKGGNLDIVTDDEQHVQMQKPFVYQTIEGNKVEIPGAFVLLAKNDIGFVLGNYDSSKELVIDPILTYSTYLGGSGDDVATAIAVDSSGNAYVTGSTDSINFPKKNPYQASLAGAQNVFVSKLNADGTQLFYSTYLGGGGADTGLGIAVDVRGFAYVTGRTISTDFPITGNAYQSTRGSSTAAFVTKLNTTGNDLIYSTYLRAITIGGVGGNGIAVDLKGNAYITGQTNSANFPVTLGAPQATFGGSSDAFVTKLDPLGTFLVYSTYLGGSSTDIGQSIAVDLNGNAYVTGQTNSINFPTTSKVFQTQKPGIINAFVTRLNASGTAFLYSTYLGGNQADIGFSIAVDSSGNAYVAGQTKSTNFPTTPNAFQTTNMLFDNAFVTKLNPLGTGLLYSTYLGGSGVDLANGIAVDSKGNIYVAGQTNSINFPITSNAVQMTRSGTFDAFLAKFNPSLFGPASLVFSTYFGGNDFDAALGIAVDSNGNAYIAGDTSSLNFPTTSGAFQPVYGGGFDDGFIAKFAIGDPIVTQINPNSGPTGGGTTVAITGMNLSGVTDVHFGTTSALSFTEVSPTQIIAVSPRGTGTVDVTVITSLGTSAITAADQFNYQAKTSIVLVASPNSSSFGQPVTLTATIAPSSATGAVSFFDGTTLLETATLSNGLASLTTSSLAIGNHTLTAVYSGATNFSGSTSSVVNLVVAPAVFPPTDLDGVQIANRFLTQTEYVNILTWEAPAQGNAPVAYVIYRNSDFTKLAAKVSANRHLRFEDHNRKKGKTYTYYVVSVDQFGNVSAPSRVTVKPNKKG